MAMNLFGIVESFQIFENQSIRLFVIIDFKSVQLFAFNNRMEDVVQKQNN